MKKSIKRLAALVCALICVMSVAVLSACSNGTREKGEVAVYAPEGAPALSLGMMMLNYKSADISDTQYSLNYSVIAASDISLAVATNKADIAVMPINAAANLYNKSNSIVMAGVVTHGNLYFVSKTKIESVADLSGKVVGVIGNGNVPDLTLRALLNNAKVPFKSGTAPVQGSAVLSYKADGASVIAALSASTVDIGLMGEPAATSAINRLGSEYSAYSMQEFWKSDFNSTDYPQAAIVVRKTFLDNNTAFVNDFIAKLSDNIKLTADNLDNVKSAITENLQEGVVSTMAAVNLSVFNRCNVYYTSAADSRAAVEVLLNKFIDLSTEAQPVLSKLPSDGFYYSAAN